MFSYYQRFFPNISEVANHLIKLAKIFTKFERTKECQLTFEYPKELLKTTVELAYPNMSKPFILYTDANDGCIVAYLTQVYSEDNNNLANGPCEKPIYFLSHKLT